MDFEKLKQSVENIELPREAQTRIIRNCQATLFDETEEKNMNTFWSKKHILTAAAIGLCLCLTVGVSAAGSKGFLRDIQRLDGAVIGAQYEQATNEITASVCAISETALTVSVSFVQPDAIPYRTFEQFGIDAYQITDASGSVVAEGGRTALAELSDGAAQLQLPLSSLPAGTYRLTITSFVGASKADAPLPLYGAWTCDFSMD